LAQRRRLDDGAGPVRRRDPVQWRISLAEIEREGPFSDYSGYDRSIVAQDEGFTLEFADGDCVEVAPMVPFSFAGERAVVCRLHGAPATAFNVMTLRDAFAHDVRVAQDEIEVQLTPEASPNTRIRETP